MKKCRTCKEEIEEILFGKNKNSSDGLRDECKECRNAKLRTGKPNLGRFQKGVKRPDVSDRKKKEWKNGLIKLKPFEKGHIPWNASPGASESKNGRHFREWSKLVKEKDNFICQKCGENKNLHSHHIVHWDENEELRFELSNGITLCNKCHGKEDQKYRWKGREKTQFKVGHKLSEESIEKMKNSKIGKPSWNKGKKLSEEHIKNMREARLGYLQQHNKG